MTTEQILEAAIRAALEQAEAEYPGGMLGLLAATDRRHHKVILEAVDAETED